MVMIKVKGLSFTPALEIRIVSHSLSFSLEMNRQVSHFEFNQNLHQLEQVDQDCLLGSNPNLWTLKRLKGMVARDMKGHGP